MWTYPTCAALWWPCSSVGWVQLCVQAIEGEMLVGQLVEPAAADRQRTDGQAEARP